MGDSPEPVVAPVGALSHASDAGGLLSLTEADMTEPQQQIHPWWYRLLLALGRPMIPNHVSADRL